MGHDPRALVERLEAGVPLPGGSDERFSGYGVMGLPFRSGHVLAMRRFPVSSVGPGYASVWHRSPGGEWRFYSDAAPGSSCTRYFGLAAADAIETPIHITWPGPFRLRVEVSAAPLEWELSLGSTPAMRLMNAAGRLLADGAWRRPAVLATMGAVAGPLLGLGRVGLHGRVPNGQRFVANPRTLWAVADSRAVLGGDDLGPPGAVRPQARLEDFWIPQRGVVAIGQAYFEPFDAARHSTSTRRRAPGTR